MSYSHSVFKTPCPQCKGVETVIWVSWDADCRGNDGGYSILCEQCKTAYTSEVWRVIARREIALHQREYWNSQYKAFGPYEFSPYHPDYNFRKLIYDEA